MNLLIEQRPSSIPSSNTQSQSSEQSTDNDMNNSSSGSSSSSSSSLVLKIKRHTTKQQTNDSASTPSSMAEDEDDDDDNRQSSRSTTHHSRLKRPNSSSSNRRPSSPAFNGKQQQQQGTKRSVTIDNNNNDLPSHLEEISARKRFKPDDCNSSSSKVDASVETVSIGLATEPDHLGPCEPGTSVVLEGIVWNETDSGVLVVNVTWRGKTYVGTLLDSTKQDWACPRLTCDSPTSDYDGRNTNKNSRSKRTSAGANTRSSTQHQAVSSFQQITSIILSSGIDDRRLRNNIKSRQSKRINQLSIANADETTNSSSPLTSPHRTNQTFFSSETSTSTNGRTSEPQLIPCSESNCHKRFASNVALSYHMSDAHPKSSNTSTIVSQASTRDEEDVAHILANVAHYARRVSPSSSIRSSPDRSSTARSSPNPAHSPPSNRNLSQTTTLTWPCPQFSSKLVQPAALNNDERSVSPNTIRSPSVNPPEPYSGSNIVETGSNTEQEDSKHSIVRLQEDLEQTSPVSILPTHHSPLNSAKIDQNNNKQRPSSPTTTSSSSFVPITLPSSIPPTASSPAYSDISDEETTITPHEQMLPPSTINLLASTNGRLDDNGNKICPTAFLPSNGGLATHPDLSNPAWTAQMLFQQFGPFIAQPGLVPTPTSIVPSTTKETEKRSRSNTPNGLNSKIPCPSTNGSSDSMVKNILDARRSSSMKPSSSPPVNLYHFHSNGTSTDTKYSPSIINTLTSPNENLLHPSNNLTATASTTATSTISTLKPMDILDFSLNPSHSTTINGQYPHSSSLHPSR